MQSSNRPWAFLPALLALILSALPASAADPAASGVARFNAALLGAMHAGKTLGVAGRFRVLAPAVRRAFDLPAMTGAVVGPAVAQAGRVRGPHVFLIRRADRAGGTA